MPPIYPLEDPVSYTSDEQDPLSFVAVSPRGAEAPTPGVGRVMVDAIHDGATIPPEFLIDAGRQPIPRARFQRAYEDERDWGAAMVAEAVAGELGLGGYYRVNIARVLMDYGRFPGITRKEADHLKRFAINHPFATLLSHEQKRDVLARYYDRISNQMDDLVRGKLVKIAIHTYDTYNKSGTRRPQVSLVTRAAGYQDESRMPLDVFDPLYPDDLAEVTCDRILRDRISLTLQSAGVPVTHNYPYLLPDGSIEVRAQVWFFFDFLRRRFQERYPETCDLPAYRMVWDLLMDTNLRDTQSEGLRSYLHMFRRAPPALVQEFADAERAYRAVQRFMESDNAAVVEAYRFDPERPSCLAIEIRKDLVWEFDDDYRPVRPRVEQAQQIGALLAEAIRVYLTEDRQHRTPRYLFNSQR